MRSLLVVVTLAAGWSFAAECDSHRIFTLTPTFTDWSTDWSKGAQTAVLVEDFDKLVKTGAQVEILASVIDNRIERALTVVRDSKNARRFIIATPTPTGIIVFRVFANYGDLEVAAKSRADARFAAANRLAIRNSKRIAARNASRVDVRKLMGTSKNDLGLAVPSELSTLLSANAKFMAGGACPGITDEAKDQCQFRGEVAAATKEIFRSRPQLAAADASWYSAERAEFLALMEDEQNASAVQQALGPSSPILLQQTEAPTNNKEYFSSVPWAGVDAHRQASASSSGMQYLLIQNVPHETDATFQWKELRIDASANMMNIVRFVTFVVAGVSKLPVSISSVASDDSSEPITQAPVKLHAPLGKEEAVDRLPLVTSGHRFIGPISLDQDSRYELSIVEKQADTTKAPSVAFASKQKVTIDPRFRWDVSVLAGFDATFSPTLAAYEKPVWVPYAAAGTGSTLFRLEPDRQWLRLASVSFALALITPYRPGQGPWRLLLLPISVGVPLASPKGISQLTTGFGFRHDSGFVLSAVGGIRFIDRASDEDFGATITLVNTGASPATAPTIVTTTGGVPVFGINASFDLAVIGKELFTGISGLFNGANK